MIELEAKFRVDDHDTLRARLRESGAEFVGKYLEWNTILDRRDGALRAIGSGLRVRQMTTLEGAAKPATITYKGPRQPGAYKNREEIETAVNDADAALDLLQRIEFVTTVSYEKRRETWRLGDCTIELDEAPLIGRFIEIEGSTEADIDSVCDTLGLAGHEHITSSYVRMISEACSDLSRMPLDVTF